jgi:hypothetical protein
MEVPGLQFWITTALSVVGLWLQYKQTRLHGRSLMPGSVYARDSLAKKYWPMMVMGVLVLALWVPFAYQLYRGEAGQILLGWGSVGPSCSAAINGDRLVDYVDEFEVAFVCGIPDSRIARERDTKITVSALFPISPGRINISADYSQAMRDAFAEQEAKALKGTVVPTSTWYRVILLPKGFDVRRIRTLSDVETAGGVMVERGGRTF